MRYQTYIVSWKSGVNDGGRGKNTRNLSQNVIRYIHDKYSHKCARCSWSQINPTTSKVPLEIDHIDGDSENNHESNLILLCPNYHSLTPTYKNSNGGRGRLWRKQKYVLQ